jgi:hypothetical protein
MLLSVSAVGRGESEGVASTAHGVTVSLTAQLHLIIAYLRCPMLLIGGSAHLERRPATSLGRRTQMPCGQCGAAVIDRPRTVLVTISGAHHTLWRCGYTRHRKCSMSVHMPVCCRSLPPGGQSSTPVTTTSYESSLIRMCTVGSLFCSVIFTSVGSRSGV